MSRVCSICGKGKMSGNTVSHSNRKAPKLWNANVHKVTFVNADGKVESGYVCTRCMKSGKAPRNV